jgi:hypothetical protein
MARYIHCEKCNREMTASAKEFGELYESVEGKAKGNLRCDGCGVLLSNSDKCYAAVLLTNNSHPQYSDQKLEVWAHKFLTTEPVKK